MPRSPLIVALGLATAAALARAEDLDLPGLQPPTIIPFVASANVSADRELPVEVRGQPTEFSRSTLRASAKAPVWQSDHDELMLTASAIWARIQSEAVFPHTGPLP